MMMTATQRKKGSGQNPVLLQNILPARSLREVIRNQKSIRRKARKGDINLTLQNLMLSERRIKKKKTRKVKKTELDKDQNQNTNHPRKRLERILYVFRIVSFLYLQNEKMNSVVEIIFLKNTLFSGFATIEETVINLLTSFYTN
jgi:hypothetical protein